jgi:glycerol-3-phosphate dehydrogenase (NAD(P)+)
MADSAKIAIIGAGTWGATLARTLATCRKRVSLYTRHAAKADLINLNHAIEQPFSISIPANVIASSNLGETVAGAGIILLCSPSSSVRQLSQEIAEALSEKKAGFTSAKHQPIIVSAVKGLELKTLSRMSEVVKQIMPDLQVCCLSGPNLANEILRDLPAASVIACENIAVAEKIQNELSSANFRIYTNSDLIGVELGGTLKNVIAIACGCCDGLRLGSNAKAALITRGLAEMTRLAVALGARPLTLSGLAGMGDLIATCDGTSSRNYRLGYEFAAGKPLKQILVEVGAVVEGVNTASAVCELSKREKIDMPIANQVDDALTGKTSPQGAIMSLLSRPLASEQISPEK